MSRSFADKVAATERLYILRVLHEDMDAAMNEQIVRLALDAIRLTLSQDALRAHLRWLEARDLITLEVVGDAATATGGLLIAALTQRGADVATGRARIDGVAPWRPY